MTRFIMPFSFVDRMHFSHITHLCYPCALSSFATPFPLPTNPLLLSHPSCVPMRPMSFIRVACSSMREGMFTEAMDPYQWLQH